MTQSALRLGSSCCGIMMSGMITWTTVHRDYYLDYCTLHLRQRIRRMGKIGNLAKALFASSFDDQKAFEKVMMSVVSS